jgi:DNA-directed RNA polymerase I, II, and III subunit RPABC2
MSGEDHDSVTQEGSDVDDTLDLPEEEKKVESREEEDEESEADDAAGDDEADDRELDRPVFYDPSSHENSTLVIVVDSERRLTSEVMTSFEYTECISIRTEQIAHNGNCMVDITGLWNPMHMAERELQMRRCPLILRRHVGSGMHGGKLRKFVEDWSPNEMQFPRNGGRAG